MSLHPRETPAQRNELTASFVLAFFCFLHNTKVHRSSRPVIWPSIPAPPRFFHPTTANTIHSTNWSDRRPFRRLLVRCSHNASPFAFHSPASVPPTHTISQNVNPLPHTHKCHISFSTSARVRERRWRRDGEIYIYAPERTRNIGGQQYRPIQNGGLRQWE